MIKLQRCNCRLPLNTYVFQSIESPNVGMAPCSRPRAVAGPQSTRVSVVQQVTTPVTISGDVTGATPPPARAPAAWRQPRPRFHPRSHQVAANCQPTYPTPETGEL
ncbi:hypothetical protein JYU34_000821 [Plutella xylostella]|uniref:Uncharacterized protein n=1 Tax=Plutella xylostella TaxID=51655 RepID=A0ABQ7R8P0_PLUXY|nr:hypothetical protein JYU34_000821 [Plutella xylostella]